MVYQVTLLHYNDVCNNLYAAILSLDDVELEEEQEEEGEGNTGDQETAPRFV